jgi:hypothetical protein
VAKGTEDDRAADWIEGSSRPGLVVGGGHRRDRERERERKREREDFYISSGRVCASRRLDHLLSRARRERFSRCLSPPYDAQPCFGTI